MKRILGSLSSKPPTTSRHTTSPPDSTPPGYTVHFFFCDPTNLDATWHPNPPRSTTDRGVFVYQHLDKLFKKNILLISHGIHKQFRSSYKETTVSYKILCRFNEGEKPTEMTIEQNPKNFMITSGFLGPDGTAWRVHNVDRTGEKPVFLLKSQPRVPHNYENGKDATQH